MAYSKKKTTQKGAKELITVFLAGMAMLYIPGLEGITEVALIGLISALVASSSNYLKHK